MTDYIDFSTTITPSRNLSHSWSCPQVMEQSDDVPCTCGAEATEAERAAKMRDAARYRWLRAHDWDDALCAAMYECQGAEMDAAVDAAMAAVPAQIRGSDG